MDAGTWKCHVCGDERPDDKISVYTTTDMVNRVQIDTNVRYCNDRPACAGGAPAVAERWRTGPLYELDNDSDSDRNTIVIGVSLVAILAVIVWRFL